jgi:glycine oxidase
LTEKRSFDAIFVGGGVIGLSCAWRAAQRGARVAVLERGDAPAGATRVAAGMLAPVGELAFGEPGLLRMTLESAQLYPGFVAELEAASGQATGFAQQGALHVALDRDEAAQLRRVHDLQRSLGLEAEWLPPRRCRGLEPGLTPSFNGGVHAPGEASVDPRALTAALLAALGQPVGDDAADGVAAAGSEAKREMPAPRHQDAGGMIVQAPPRSSKPTVEVRTGCEVVAGLFEGERLTGVRTAAGEELRADAVVLATGAWSGRTEWLPERARPPVRPVKGQILGLRSRDGSPPCGRIVASERVYLVPRADGRLIAGATVEEQGFDTTVTAGGVHELLREAYRLLPDVAEMELLDVSAGLRPGTPDNLPLIGPGAIEGLILATGHYRNGVLLAPLTADAVAAVLAGDPLPETAAAANPARSSFVSHSDTKDDRTLGKVAPERGAGSAPDRAAELARRGAALAQTAEAAERAAGAPS